MMKRAISALGHQQASSAGSTGHAIMFLTFLETNVFLPNLRCFYLILGSGLALEVTLSCSWNGGEGPANRHTIFTPPSYLLLVADLDVKIASEAVCLI